MGKLNVSMLRYLSSEEFRVLTAVSEYFILLYMLHMAGDMFDL